MTRLIRFFAVFTIFAPLMFAVPAFALSIDHDTGMNSDGTPKFTDPDEQQPGSMTPPDQQPAVPQARPSMGLSANPGANTTLSVNHFGQQQQPDAFDQAFDNK